MLPELLPPATIERMLRPVELVRDRLRRTAAALEQAKVPYAVIGGNAVAAWVTRVDPSAVRFTQDVDILINRKKGDIQDCFWWINGAIQV